MGGVCFFFEGLGDAFFFQKWQHIIALHQKLQSTTSCLNHNFITKRLLSIISLFFFFCTSSFFYLRLLPWAESCLPVFVSGSSVKMAAIPVWAPLLPIQPQPKVWNRLHLILNTWQQLERRKGERRKKSKKKRKKRKTKWICQRAFPSYLPSLCP